MTFHLNAVDGDGEVLFDGPLEDGEHTHTDLVDVWWVGPQGEQRYTMRDVEFWTEVPAGRESEGRMVYLGYTDDTQTNPRKAGQPADIRHTIEFQWPGGGMGPFLVTFSEPTEQ